jgi:hypothetical protein
MSKTSFDNLATSREFDAPQSGFFRSAFGGSNNFDSAQSDSALREKAVEANSGDPSSEKENGAEYRSS